MSRQKNDPLEFGSDSFLDVVANIVGILIILIVVTGMKVSREPLYPITAVEESADLCEFPISPANEESEIDEPIIVLLDEEPETSPDPPELPPLPSVVRPSELITQAEQLDADNQRLQARLASLTSDTDRQSDEKQQLSQQVTSLREQLTQEAAVLRRLRDRVGGLDEQVTRSRSEIALQEQDLRQVQQQKKPEAEVLAHRLTPVGRLVSGREVHFRMVGNRVSYVPVMQLAEQLQRDINRRKDAILSQSVYQGTVGPLDGYIMEYVLQRQTNSLLDEVRYGRATIRMGVTGWAIRPVDGLVEETLEQAQQPRSRFQQALRREGATATITFWVYPDSFEIHKELKTLVHDSGFWVASRPLPEGVPIAGSPQGSKSLAQ